MVMIGLLEVFIAFVFYILFQCLLLQKKTHPALPQDWPVLRMFPRLLFETPRVFDWLVEALEASSLTFHFKGPWFSGMDLLVTADPANIHHVQSSNFANYPKGMEFRKIFDVFGDGIFTADSELWADLRSSAHAILGSHQFHNLSVSTSLFNLKKGLIPILENAVEKNIVVDLQDVFHRFMFDISSILMMGYDPSSLSIEMPEVEFGEAVDGAAEAVFYRYLKPVFLWKLQYWIGFGIEKRLRRGLETFDRLFSKIISAKREENISKGEAMDVLSYYMNVDTTKYKFLKPNNDKFLRDAVLALLLAGKDTTTLALTWFFWLLTNHPQVMTKIRDEINTKMPKFNLADLEKLVYLHGSVCETLRLYPPVPFNHKSPIKPDVLPSGHKVDANKKILISIYALGRMKSVWGEDAALFKPERWILETGKLRYEPSYKFLPFSSGPRTCLGKKFTFLQMKTVAVEIIRNYEVKVVDQGHKTEPVPSVLLRIPHGLKVTITKI